MATVEHKRFLGNHHAELDGYFEIAEVIIDTILRIRRHGWLLTILGFVAGGKLTL